MEQLAIRLTSTRPMLMHNGQLADPLNRYTKMLKSVTSKRGKTDEDHELVAQYEFQGSLYFNDADGWPYVPGENLFRSLVDAAKMNKLGTRVTQGLQVLTETAELAYSGPRTREGLWADANFRHMAGVKVGTQRVMRCRPVFRSWAAEFLLLVDTELLDTPQVMKIAEQAGQYKGLGDWRPRFGTFAVERVA